MLMMTMPNILCNINRNSKLLLLLLLTGPFLTICDIIEGCELQSTEIVICTGLELLNIPTTFDANLETLFLSHNNISTLDSNVLEKYPKIETLIIDYNHIKTPDDFENVGLLLELRYFDISNNLLDVLDFSKLHLNRNLKNFTANNNVRLKIHNYSAYLPNLFKISLRNCTLTDIPSKAFEGFVNLHILDLRDNHLKCLPDNMLDALPKLQNLLIINNPIIDLQPQLLNVSDLGNIIDQKSTSIGTYTAHTTTWLPFIILICIVVLIVIVSVIIFKRCKQRRRYVTELELNDTEMQELNAKFS